MSVLSTDSEQQIKDTLVSSEFITKEKLEEAEKAAEKAHEPLFAHLVKNNLITDEQLTKVHATMTKVPYVNLTAADIVTGKQIGRAHV